ncbi:MAG: helix-turn-helix domain-containing protein [Chitinispirillales bacterium]|nr:helix-turn-helix domain-containing protein [Chitinispirillales bacterium]
MSEFLTSKQVAEQYGVHRNTVMNWVKAGRLTPVRLSRRYYLFKREDLEAFERGGRVIPTSAPVAEMGGTV